MERISRLRHLLLISLEDGREQYNQQDLFDELIGLQPNLTKLFDVGPTNVQEKAEVESGKINIRGKTLAVNSDFAKQVVFVSAHLGCSERYIASILHDIMSTRPNLSATQYIELTIAEFHQRRRHLVDSLCYLFKAAEAAQYDDPPQLLKYIDAFVRSDLVPPRPGSSNNLITQICREIDSMGATLAKADVERKSARTETVPPSQTPGSLGVDILNSRYDSLKYERRNLGNALISLARLGLFTVTEIKHITDWLSANPDNALTYYMLTALLATLDPVDPQSSDALARGSLAYNSSVVGYMTQKLASPTQWKDTGLKSVLLLKWILFLTDARHRKPEVENQEEFRTEVLENHVKNAVQGDAFTYLTLSLMQMQRRSGANFTLPASLGLLNLTLNTLDQQDQCEVPSDDSLLIAYETLLRSLIMHASSELRKIKQRQEDLVLAGARTARAIPAMTETPRNDTALLFVFIGLLYTSLPPEAALQFWGSSPTSTSSYLHSIESAQGKLPSFLQWAVWCAQPQDTTMSTALYDMLSGLAKGQQCSELAYNFMARGTGEVVSGTSISGNVASSPVSWSVIFSLLEAWTTQSMKAQTTPTIMYTGSFQSQQPPQPQPQPPQPQTPNITPREVLFAQSFLALLSTVVSYSVAVRMAISSHAHFRAIPTIVALLPLGIPLELKGTLLSTLAAFCSPSSSSGAAVVEICRAVWTLMERYEVINTTKPGSPLGLGKGIEKELEDVEAVHGVYPASIPFLGLLATMIHTPKRIPLRERLNEMTPLTTVPETLGQPYRLPGIGPFVAFVIDTVFTKIPTREYVRASDRWQMNDLCLCFIERALASFDLDGLLSAAESRSLKQEELTPLLVHPGHDVLKRILTNSPLQSNILSYIVEGVEGFDKGYASEEPFYASTIIRVLRIVLRVLEIQDIFLDVFIPILSEFDSAPVVGHVHPRSFYTKFDRTLSYAQQLVPALAAYVSYSAHPELVYLSVKILSELSSSNAFLNLAMLVEKSVDSDRILTGFTSILESEAVDDVLLAEGFAEQATGVGAPDPDPSLPLSQAIRLAVLDFLITNSEINRPYPNLAHFLLFGSAAKNRTQIDSPRALNARQACIHVILDMLNVGIPSLKGAGGDNPGVPLFITQPALAERCYRLLYKLCLHPRTSEFTMRYLRTEEDFFARHLSAIPSKVPETTLQEHYVQVLYEDGSRVTTTVPALSSFLRLRSWIFDLSALDLHVLANKGHHKAISELLGILFGNASFAERQEWEDMALQSFHEVGQSHMRIIELVQSLTFDWSDSLNVDPIELQLLSRLNLSSCVRRDGSGCEVIDRTSLVALLTAARRTLHAQNAIVTPAHAERLNLETTYVLESCAVENHRREVIHATSIGYDAWRRLLDTALMRCFDRLPHDQRENMLFDLLHVLPPILHTAPLEEATTVLLSEVVLSCITKLREDRRHQIILQSTGGDPDAGTLPAERLYSILRSIIECIIDNNRVELVRGNLYAALINYFHLISPSSTGSSPNLSSSLSLTSSMSVSRSLSTFRESTPLGDSLALTNGSVQDKNRSLQATTLTLMKTVMERLVATIARDAIDGTEIWKTVAFMLLDCLVHVSEAEKQHTVLSSLLRHGILSNFVQGLRESDLLLQAVLKPDPDDLNPLYVYEAKMTFFLRMAQSRAGAERLLEARIMPVLGMCDYLDARPDGDQSFIDNDTFLPSAMQRYHQIFTPALQLVNEILSTLGNKHTTASNQALDFVSRHGSTIVILLKSEPSEISLSLLEELNLVVSLCADVLHLVPKSELGSSTSGFGAIHAAILGLSARCLRSRQWFDDIRPESDNEIFNASVLASGFASTTKFDIGVLHKERQLRKALVSYVGTASDFTEPEITLTMSPLTAVPRQDEQNSRYLRTLPSIGDAIEALNMFCNDFSEALKQISDISAELARKELIGVENIEKVVRDVDTSIICDLDIGQKRVLVARQLERLQDEAISDARVTLQTTEMLLLLLWRHLTYYLEETHLKSPRGRQDMAQTMRLLANPDPAVLREEVNKKLAPTLQRLQVLVTEWGSAGNEEKANRIYVDIMCRRLREAMGIVDG